MSDQRQRCPVRRCGVGVAGTEKWPAEGENFECSRGHYLEARRFRLVHIRIPGRKPEHRA